MKLRYLPQLSLKVFLVPRAKSRLARNLGLGVAAIAVAAAGAIAASLVTMMLRERAEPTPARKTNGAPEPPGPQTTAATPPATIT
jgi:hypothetical protein